MSMTNITQDQSGLDIIGEERWRQQLDPRYGGEGYDAAHDAQEKPGALAMAAIAYATMASSSDGMRQQLREGAGHSPFWPWSADAWKPGHGDSDDDRIKELGKAGALIAAEIDRIRACRGAENVA